MLRNSYYSHLAVEHIIEIEVIFSIAAYLYTEVPKIVYTFREMLSMYYFSKLIELQ